MITPKLILNVWRQWWKIAMPLGLILAAVGCVAVFAVYRPQYEAKSLLWIDDEKPYILSPSGVDRDFVADQQGLIRSSLVLGPVISRPEIGELPELAGEDDPVEKLADMIRVKAAGGTKLFHLVCTSHSAENAHLIANAVTESYFRLADEFEAGRTTRLIELLEQAKLEKERLVERLKDNIRVLSRQQSGDDLAAAPGWDETQQRINPLADLQARLHTVRVELEVIKSQLKAFEEYLQTTPIQVQDDEVGKLVADSAEVLNLKQAISRRQAEAAETLSRSARGQNDPQYQRLQREIAADEQFLADSQVELAAELKRRLETEQTVARDEQLATMRETLEAYLVRERVLEEALTQQTAKLKLSRTENLELEFRRRELLQEEKLLESVAERLHLLRTEQRAPARVELKQPATMPRSPEDPIPFKQLVLAGGAGLALPFLLALLWEMQLQRVTDTRQLVEHGKLSVVGEIVHASRFRSRGGRVNKALRLFEESVDHLRTHLVLSQSLEKLQVVAVLSAASGEGKTTVAAQLAVSLARSTGERTLLIDSDLRAPDVHDLFELELEPGLAQVLSHEVALEQAVVGSWLECLDVLPAGRLCTNPHKLVGNGAWRDLLDEARARYRYVVIDTPPVLPAGESLVLAKSADAAILCVRRDVSRVDQVQRSYERLHAAGANLVGCVMNGVPRRRYEHSYGYYYGNE